MSSIKARMSTSYKAVFTISIFMIFAVIIGGAVSGSKSLGWGVWYWGYTAWKMYKRDNESLIVIQKVVLWFEAVAFSIAFAVLMFSDAEISKHVGFTPLSLIIIAALSMSVTYSLYRYFHSQLSSTSSLVNVPLSSDSVSDKHWEQASRELEGLRHEATWARAVSAAEGDDAKAKAIYLKMRAMALHNSQGVVMPVLTNDVSASIAQNAGSGLWSVLNRYGLILAIVTVGAFFAYVSFYSPKERAAQNVEVVPEKSSTESVEVVADKKLPFYRQMADGTTLRWSRDKECFVMMKLDFSNSVNPVILGLTSNNNSERFKELTQDNLVIAVVFYDFSVSDADITKHINKKTFLNIKGLCEANF